jgi:hypothetical protein
MTPFIWAIIIAAVLAPTTVKAHAVSTHKNITSAAVSYLGQLDERAKCSTNLNQLLQVGTVAEDDNPRPVFHFTPALSASSSTCSSVDWGFGSATCRWALGTLTNTHRWQDAITHAKDQKTGKPSEEGLRDLGFVVHLIQDLTSPAHTRNDDHLNAFGVGDIDPVEAVTRTPTMPNVAEGLVAVSSPDALFAQLGQFTRSNFYSKDTVFLGDGPTSVRQDTNYFYDVTGRRIAYKSLVYRTKELFGDTPDPRSATINDVIAADQFGELGPVAVKYTASLIKHYLDVTTAASPSKCFVDFEEFSGNSTFTGVQPPLKSGGAIFSGGQILKGTTFLPRDQSVVYGTAFFCPGCATTISIDLDTPVDGISLLLMNGQTFQISYTVVDDKGGRVVQSLPPNSASGSAIVTLASPGITNVMISSSTSSWDFFIDNVTLGTASSAKTGAAALGQVSSQSATTIRSSIGVRPAGRP